MNATEAARFINGLALKPGWSIEAEPSRWVPHVIGLAVSFAAQDSDYPPDYRVKLADRPIHRSITVTPDMSRAAITAKVLRTCLELEIHEWLEFTRYRDESGRWVAPFHPHRSEGHANWMTGAARPRLEASLAA